MAIHDNSICTPTSYVAKTITAVLPNFVQYFETVHKPYIYLPVADYFQVNDANCQFSHCDIMDWDAVTPACTMTQAFT
jgi:hypothetical protein